MPLPTRYILSALLLLLTPFAALAYVGPGSGLSAIGSILALIIGLLVALLGFFWYPIKRLLGKKKSKEPEQPDDEEQ